MPLIYSSDSSDDEPSSGVRLFGRQRPLHAVLGGGTVADVLLWKKKNLSAANLIAFTVIWFLFEVVEYHFVTLLCHMLITIILIVFIWSNGASLFDWRPPKLPDIIVSDSAFEEIASRFHKNLNRFLSILYDIACGKNLKIFFLAMTSLWILSIIGTYFSALNLLYLGFLCIATLPALYEQYENEVEHLASKGHKDMKKIYKKVDSNILNKIPRGPVKGKKLK